MAATNFTAPPRIYYLPHRYVGAASALPRHLDRCQEMGFGHVLMTPPFRSAESGDVFLTSDHEQLDSGLNSSRDASEFLLWLAQECESRGLALLLDLSIDQFAAEHPLTTIFGDCFSFHRDSYASTVDPRHDTRPSGAAMAHLSDSHCRDRLVDWWGEKLSHYLALGVAGFRFIRPDALPPESWRKLLSSARKTGGQTMFIASSYGMSRDAVRMLENCGFDYLQSSLPWWDFRSSWLVEEHEALRLIAPLIGAPEDPLGARLTVDVSSPRRMKIAYERMLTLAYGTGCGIMIPMGYEYGMQERYDARRSRCADFERAVAQAPFDLSVHIRAANDFLKREPLLRRCGNLRGLTGPNSRVTALLRRDMSATRVTDDALLILINPDQEQPSKIQDWRIVPGIGAVAETIRPLEPHTPDIELDDEAAVLLAPGEARLLRIRQHKPIKSRLTSRRRLLAAAKAPRIIIDNIAPAVLDTQGAKRTIGEAVRVEADVLCDGRQWLGVDLLWRASDEASWHRQKMNFIGAGRWSGTFFLSRLGTYEFAVQAWIDRYGAFQRELLEKVEARIELGPHIEKGKAALTDAARVSTGAAAQTLQEKLRDFESLKEEEKIALLLDSAVADHVATGLRPFSTRSATHLVESERAVAAFANWYKTPSIDSASGAPLQDVARALPQVRALGFNVMSLTLPHCGGPNDNGVGSAADWQELFTSAKRYEVEIAVEFPLRPAVGNHEGQALDRPDLAQWTELRDLWFAWSATGLNIFCIREPAEMPFAFWRWIIADLKRYQPYSVFVAGTTGDKTACRLAKEGFSQSLIGLPWPMNKHEAMRHFDGLQSGALREFFRPQIRINASERHIHDEQARSGADFLAQCALAATLSGSWSVAPQDAQSLLTMGDHAANSIYVRTLARLNWIRTANPALHRQEGLTFYNAHDDRVIYYGRSTPERDDILLVAVNMAPQQSVETAFEVPLWEWGLPDDASVDADDLLAERRFVWRGKIHRVRFDPQRLPFAVWRIQPHR